MDIKFEFMELQLSFDWSVEWILDRQIRYVQWDLLWHDAIQVKLTRNWPQMFVYEWDWQCFRGNLFFNFVSDSNIAMNSKTNVYWPTNIHLVLNLTVFAYLLLQLSFQSLSIKFFPKFQSYSIMPDNFQSNCICLKFTVIILYDWFLSVIIL